MVIISDDVLIPAEVTDLFLFSYPVPLSTILIVLTIDFFSTHSRECFPIPVVVKTTVLIPAKESPKSVCNFTVFPSTTDA